ncbi:MAG: AI-2E family transporter [Isosphaeraceae bacterium]
MALLKVGSAQRERPMMFNREQVTTGRQSVLSSGASLVISLTGLLCSLYFFKPILIPMTLAVILSCTLMPATLFIRRTLKVSQFMAALLLVIILGASGGYLGFIVIDRLAEFTMNVPIDLSRLSSKISQNLTEIVRDNPRLDRVIPEPGLISTFLERNVVRAFQDIADPASNVSTLASQGFLTLVLAIFFTVEQPILEPRLAAALSRSAVEKEFFENLFRHLSRRMRQYLIVRAGINAFFGLSVAITLSLLGIEYAGLLGLFAGLANFVPYIGQAGAGIFLGLVAMAQTGSIVDLIIVIFAFAGLSIAEGYLLTPIVMGRTMDLNGTTVLVSCLFWGFMWGVVGLIIATPVAALARLTLERFPEGRRWAMLMSQVPEESAG